MRENEKIHVYENWTKSLTPTHLMLNVTVSSKTVCVTYLDSFFSSMPFLCSVAMKSVNGRDIRNCNSMMRPAKINGPCKCEKRNRSVSDGVSPKWAIPIGTYLMCDWNHAKQTCGFGWSPFAAGTIRQRHHYCLQFFATNLKRKRNEFPALLSLTRQ